MGACRFTLSDTNPNESIGGGGCLCSELKNDDQGGPYAVFYGNEMDSGLSPHVVLCAGCARSFVDQLDAGAELARLGEPTVEPTRDPAASTAVEQEESPELTGEELAEIIKPRKRRRATTDEELTL